MRLTARTVLTGCLLGMVVDLVPVGAAAQNEPKPLIVLHSGAATGVVSPLIFGANRFWGGDSAGSTDPASGLTSEPTVEQTKDVGIALIRFPAGKLANSFQWQRAVGPAARRSPQVSGLTSDRAPLDSRFGPDEFGDLLDKSGAVGRLVINFGSASAADAANLSAYMTSPVGGALVNGVDWAARRAANRHPTPYKIAYVEVGNGSETAPGEQSSWLQGEPTSINARCAGDKLTCLYAFGGATRFEQQSAVLPSDWRESAGLSSGEAHQTLYARYAPVAPGSESVSVNGLAWQGLSDLAAASPEAKVYRIDYPSGAITFGDGVHGALPPKGAKVTVSYTTGPHQGFVDFYRTIKAVNPSLKVCAATDDESFVRIMGAQHVYDCIQPRSRPVDRSQSQARIGGADAYFVDAATRTAGVGAQVQHTRQLVKEYAGANADKVEVVAADCPLLSEWPASPSQPARSEGAAVLEALCLREWVLTDVAAAAGAALTRSEPMPDPGHRPSLQRQAAASPGDIALFSESGAVTIATPLALAMKLLREHTGSELLNASVEGSPKLTSSRGDSVDALQIYATRDARGTIYLVVINLDPQHNIDATMRADAAPAGAAATVATLASANIGDENTPQNPQLVSIKEASALAADAPISLSFPKHSVTAIKLAAAP